jgi:hypothetical protein
LPSPHGRTTPLFTPLPRSGTTLDAQARYAAGTKEIIRRSLIGEVKGAAHRGLRGARHTTTIHAFFCAPGPTHLSRPFLVLDSTPHPHSHPTPPPPPPGEPLIPTDVIVQDGVLAPQYNAAAKASARTLEFKETWEKVSK